jgi:hypothetical protein
MFLMFFMSAPRLRPSTNRIMKRKEKVCWVLRFVKTGNWNMMKPKPNKKSLNKEGFIFNVPVPRCWTRRLFLLGPTSG